MASESIYLFGEVVLVPFPFTNQVESKKRPAVVISSSAYNTNRPDLLIMAITSQAHTAPDFSTFPVVDWQGAGLLKPSFAKPVLTTLEQTLVIRRMGSFSPRDLESLRQMLMQILG
ncbi:MAG: type II toxin-antitoxin system PemK/MazF family toxin [Gallionella sp.]|nr:type II toxin-antitoxin system PemK/MazF family toxin [Gallionella sp.]